MKSYIKFFVTSIKDIFTSLPQIFALAKFEYDTGTKDMFLGKLWKLLFPLIQIGVYWFVFGVGLRSGKPVEGIPYVVWLTCGLVPWRIMSTAVNQGSNSVFKKAVTLTRSNIPTVLIPVSSILSVFLDSLWLILILLVIFFCNGCVLTISALNLLYYIFFMLCFLVAVAELSSVLVMVARDFSGAIQMIIRLFFFLSPVIWVAGDNLPEIFYIFDKLNPFAYAIRGFRNSLLFDIPFYSDIKSILIFWGMTFVIFALGILMQSKLRNNLLDKL